MDQYFNELESIFGQTAGTSLSRIQLSVTLAEKAGLSVEKVKSPTVLVWALSFGLGQDKEYFYGLTPSEAVLRARYRGARIEYRQLEKKIKEARSPKERAALATRFFQLIEKGKALKSQLENNQQSLNFGS